MDSTIIIAMFAIYIAYWVIKAMIDKLYAEALIGMGVGVLSTQIFIVAYYYGQFLRLRLDKNINITIQVIGIMLLTGSLVVLIGALVSKRKMSNLVSFWGSTQLFMTQGIYGIIRHPVQLSGILAATGIALMMANTAVIVLGLIAIASFFAASIEEDRHGSEAIGQEYDTYMQNVPAFNLFQGLSRARRSSKS